MLISLFRVNSWFDAVNNAVTRWMNFREDNLNEHDLQLFNYNVKRYFDPNFMYFWHYLQLFQFDLEKFISKN